MFNVFNEFTLVWILISALVSILSGYLSSLLTYNIKRKEITATALAELINLQHEWKAKAENEKQERLRQEVTYWANPISSAVEDLKARLDNIINREGYPALSKDYKQESKPDWSITHDYFMKSTLFLFSSYFAWIRMLQQKLNYELFQTQKNQKDFFDAVWEVSKALSKYPPSDRTKYRGKDTQVFNLQQRAIGELLIKCENENKTSISYPDFLEKIKDANSTLSYHLEPLKILLENISKDEEYRWNRLRNAYSALITLQEACKKLLSLPKNTFEAIQTNKPV